MRIRIRINVMIRIKIRINIMSLISIRKFADWGLIHVRTFLRLRLIFSPKSCSCTYIIFSLKMWCLLSHCNALITHD